MDKKFLAIIVVIIVAFAGFLVINRKDDTASTSEQIAASASDHARGQGLKGVTLVEYADFQCPACGGFYPLIKGLEEKYGDDIKVVFKNFPLDTIHPNARATHRAAEAAGKQGKFFEMHDLLYQNQVSWSSSTNIRAVVEDYATQLGLNMDQFKADFVDESINAVINADIAEGKDKGVNSTPTFFLNGTRLNNEDIRTLEQFSKVIDDEIAKVSAQTNPSTSTGSN